MSASRPEQVTLRVSAGVAGSALVALLTGAINAFPLYSIAEALASTVGAAFDGYEVDLDGRSGQLSNRIDLFFVATPAQRRLIAGALTAGGFDLVEGAPKWGKI